MSLDIKEKKLLIAVLAVVIVGVAWHLFSTYVLPQIQHQRRVAEALAQQTIVSEGTPFTLYGRQGKLDSGNPELMSQSPAFNGTLSMRVEESRLYETKSAMEEAEGFMGDFDDISTYLSEEPLGLVVDVSITNVDATVMKNGESTTYFPMTYFGVQIGDTANMVSYFLGQDIHVPEYDNPETQADYLADVDIPKGETVRVRLTFALPSANAEDELGEMSRIISLFDEGDQIIFYYGLLDFSGSIHGLWDVSGEVVPTSFAEGAANIPYLVELSPVVM